MSGDVRPYLAKITSEHANAPRFLASLTAIVQPLADNIAVLATMPTLFDLDTAVGQQLDFVGQWIGAGRQLAVPISNVFFTWDTVGLGWEQGIWQGPFDPSTSITVLGDPLYRLLLQAKALANRWDGSIPQAYTDLQKLFPTFAVYIKDNGDMTMIVGIIGALDNVTKALFTSGVLSVRPAGVSVTYQTSP